MKYVETKGKQRKPQSAFTFTAATLSLTGTATGTTAWSASIPLLDGPNRITLTAQDTVGNISQTE